jgi:type I restriction enzyme S subunit
MEQVEAQTMRLLGTVPAGTMKSSANMFGPGDVLYGRLRSYLNKVHQPDFSGFCSGEFIVLPETCAAHGKFLKYRLNAGDFVRFASRINTGDRPRVDFDQIKTFDLALPPREEQERIADALDELLSDLDAGVAAIERVRGKLKLYRGAVLKAAVEGALTAEWRKQHPHTEPASELLKSILTERRRRWEEEQVRKFAEKGRESPENWKAKYQEPVAFDATELPELPPGWLLASMDEITSRITSGSRDWQQYYGGGTGTFVMAQNVRPGRFDPDHHQPVNPPLDDPSCDRSRVENNDLLVTIVGAKTGDVCRVPKPLNEHYVCQSVALMRPVEKRTARYLEIYYNSQNGGQRHYRRYIYGAGRPHLSFDQLKMTPVAIPPLEEQEAIVDAIEDQLSVIDHLEVDLETKLTNAQALRQSILRQAFSGKLVPQDPADEPASELVKRIAAERAQRAHEAAAAKKLNGHKRPRRGQRRPRQSNHQERNRVWTHRR